MLTYADTCQLKTRKIQKISSFVFQIALPFKEIINFLLQEHKSFKKHNYNWRTYCNLKLVCKKWNHNIHDLKNFWSTKLEVCVRNQEQLENARTLNWNIFFLSVNYLPFAFCFLDTVKYLNLQYQIFTNVNFEKIKSVTIEKVAGLIAGDQTIIDIARKNLPNLKKANIHFESYNEPFIFENFSNLCKLKLGESFTIIHCNIEVRNNSNLHTLVVKNCKSLILNQNTQLKHLNLSEVNNVTCDEFCYRSLESLTFKYCARTYQWLSKCTNLQKLTLYATDIQPVIADLKKLIYLHVISFLGDDHSLFSLLPPVKILRITSPYIHASEFEDFLNNYNGKNLIALEIDCKKHDGHCLLIHKRLQTKLVCQFFCLKNIYFFNFEGLIETYPILQRAGIVVSKVL